MDQQDETDSVTSPDPQRTKVLMDQTLAKIERTKEAMKAEQLAKDGKKCVYIDVKFASGIKNIIWFIPIHQCL